MNWVETFPPFWRAWELRETGEANANTLEDQISYSEDGGFLIKERELKLPMWTYDITGDGGLLEFTTQVLVIRMMRAMHLLEPILVKASTGQSIGPDGNEYLWRPEPSRIIDAPTRVVELLQQRYDDEKSLRLDGEICALQDFDRIATEGIEEVMSMSALQGPYASARCRIVHMKHLGGYGYWVRHIAERIPERVYRFDGTMASIPPRDPLAIIADAKFAVMSEGQR